MTLTRFRAVTFLAIFSLVVVVHYTLTKSTSRIDKLLYQDSEAYTRQFHPDNSTLGIVSEIYVVSLPRRTDRRLQMERLRVLLGLDWMYYPATEVNNAVIHAITQRVRVLHQDCSEVSSKCTFSWPEDIAAFAASMRPLDLWNADFLTNEVLEDFSNDALSGSALPPLTCTTQDFNITRYSHKTPQHLLLTPARIACWHSHLSVIRNIANDERLGPKNAVLILEDDVDMEYDIRDQLADLWPLLPNEWDIVFLGHCWSNEAKSKPLTGSKSFSGNSSTSEAPRSKLYQSQSPRCTHAYVLTRMGARRLLLYLQYPPFAYSRAIDQAIAWLIESGKLRGYSVVPSLVSQRKIVESDVMPGKGSKWKDHLTNGVLENAI
ncbi:hypothetical protein AX17_003116 [Amanita inopinata Kibby_2008]|nr:hypothetical protein AX17_003116 [Amanita inopinata Kibby_2008]